MNSLLKQYEYTLKYTEELIRTKEYQQQLADKQNDIEMASCLKSDVAIIRGAVTDLRYCIDWLKKGHEPSVRRGIERQAGYKRETPVEPYWIQLNGDAIPTEIEKTDEELEREAMKAQLMKQIVKVLNKQEREIFEMSANAISQYEIAKMLGITRDDVKVVIARCKRKIRKEGWVMV